jgi:hypothetical protein
MDTYEEYRKRADEVQMMAAQSNNQDDKASWLRIAQGWMDAQAETVSRATLRREELSGMADKDPTAL